MNNSNMCKLYVKAGIAYEDGESIISDHTYDGLSRILIQKYESLPKWFRNKISLEDLRTGSASGFKEKFISDILR